MNKIMCLICLNVVFFSNQECTLNTLAICSKMKNFSCKQALKKKKSKTWNPHISVCTKFILQNHLSLTTPVGLLCMWRIKRFSQLSEIMWYLHSIKDVGHRVYITSHLRFSAMSKYILLPYGNYQKGLVFKLNCS